MAPRAKIVPISGRWWQALNFSFSTFQQLILFQGDHVPYGSDAATYWTGYYTSRPSLKYYFKKGHSFLQVGFKQAFYLCWPGRPGKAK